MSPMKLRLKMCYWFRNTYNYQLLPAPPPPNVPPPGTKGDPPSKLPLLPGGLALPPPPPPSSHGQSLVSIQRTVPSSVSLTRTSSSASESCPGGRSIPISPQTSLRQLTTGTSPESSTL